MQDILLVASSLDPCSINMARYILNAYNSKIVSENFYKINGINLMIINEEMIYAEWLNRIDTDLYIFLSRHRSESKIPALTSHFTGNFSDHADMGGNARELAYTFPSLQKCYMQNLSSKKDELKDYQIIIEATHHGPTSLTKPILFIEIGSSIEQWNDEHAISIVCDTLFYTLKDVRRSERIGIALGGTHYPSKFNELIIDSEYALGHIAPRYALEYIDEASIKNMIGKSIESVDAIILDKKGLGKAKDKIMSIINNFDLEVIKV